MMMTMIHGKEYVAKFVPRAVTRAEDFVIGKEYYKNGKTFVLARTLTNAECYAMDGLVYQNDDGDVLGWGITTDGETMSLGGDISGRYNPWLVFSDESTAMEYYAGLAVYYTLDPMDYYDEGDWIRDYDDEGADQSQDLKVLE